MAKMDFTQKTAELEGLVKQYASFLHRFGPNSASADNALRVWRQATWHALETAYIEGYESAVDTRAESGGMP